MTVTATLHHAMNWTTKNGGVVCSTDIEQLCRDNAITVKHHTLEVVYLESDSPESKLDRRRVDTVIAYCVMCGIPVECLTDMLDS